MQPLNAGATMISRKWKKPPYEMVTVSVNDIPFHYIGSARFKKRVRITLTTACPTKRGL